MFILKHNVVQSGYECVHIKRAMTDRKHEQGYWQQSAIFYKQKVNYVLSEKYEDVKCIIQAKSKTVADA